MTNKELQTKLAELPDDAIIKIDISDVADAYETEMPDYFAEFSVDDYTGTKRPCIELRVIL